MQPSQCAGLSDGLYIYIFKLRYGEPFTPLCKPVCTFLLCCAPSKEFLETLEHFRCSSWERWMVNSKLKHKQFQLNPQADLEMRRSVWNLSLWMSFKTPSSPPDQFDFLSSGHLPRGYANLCPHPLNCPEARAEGAQFKCPWGLGSLKCMLAVPPVVGTEPTEGFWADTLGLPGAPPLQHGAADMFL